MIIYGTVHVRENIWPCIKSKVAVSDVYGDFTYEDVYLRSWDLAKGILGLLGQVSLDFFLTSQKI